ncbi:MAG TPA: ferritin family protein [Phycisphaerae bacterium]|nr:ferritin family protein [Phycisphaerae bacterium]HOJ74061.1 ferritin family protein [Phycisphaerae bacterium]HOM50656.1 ferritin family protein [Phycisphaerae bacterium]HON68555.1 ferritin family protein [Phycisphaerae bacterium]HOQ87172.1 ferritin family protein [Phycisphaerae bacterium]
MAKFADTKSQLPEMTEDRILSIGIYGETVAAYRYTVLSEILPNEEDRAIFAAIAEEEIGHKQRLQELFNRYYPGSAFYLSDEDKALVVTGPRLIDVRNEPDYRKVMQMALETERRVAQFYQSVSTQARHDEVRNTFNDLAIEGFQHHGRLLKLARERNLLPDRSG